MTNLKKLRPIMFVGTGSDVGKSLVATAFCRVFKQDGYAPAPYKAQNMSLNSYPTADGLEMGRAQVVQAEAAGIPCQVEMNPILLKPSSDQKAQVIVNGKPIGTQSAKEYFDSTDRDTLFQEAISSYHTLATQYNPVVIEGAGSISEVNLRDRDITNMRVALAVEADTYLIADIDKGGVFGAVYGTLELLPVEERRLIKGIIVNKFRGDRSLFDDGVKILEDLTGVPVVAVLPYERDLRIDEEDTVALSKKERQPLESNVNIAVVLLPHMSNFTDFNALELVSGVRLYYTHLVEEILAADIVILPGSKNTMKDLSYLRQGGLAQAILRAHQKGVALYGICGGFQMMGEELHDPHGVEGETKSMPGLGILPIVTTLNKEKVTRQREFSFRDDQEGCRGYEIHMGVSTFTAEAEPLCTFTDGTQDGCYRDERTWGTYLHGIFDNASIVARIVSLVNQDYISDFDLETHKEEQYDQLAQMVRDHTDLERIYHSLQRPHES